MESEQLFAIDGSPQHGAAVNKKVNKFFMTEVNENAPKVAIRANKKTEPEIYDHYDINNLLRFESETSKMANKKRFSNRRVCSNSRIKPIKFKTWN